MEEDNGSGPTFDSRVSNWQLNQVVNTKRSHKTPMNEEKSQESPFAISQEVISDLSNSAEMILDDTTKHNYFQSKEFSLEDIDERESENDHLVEKMDVEQDEKESKLVSSKKIKSTESTEKMTLVPRSRDEGFNFFSRLKFVQTPPGTKPFYVIQANPNWTPPPPPKGFDLLNAVKNIKLVPRKTSPKIQPQVNRSLSPNVTQINASPSPVINNHLDVSDMSSPLSYDSLDSNSGDSLLDIERRSRGVSEVRSPMRVETGLTAQSVPLYKGKWNPPFRLSQLYSARPEDELNPDSNEDDDGKEEEDVLKLKYEHPADPDDMFYKISEFILGRYSFKARYRGGKIRDLISNHLPFQLTNPLLLEEEYFKFGENKFMLASDIAGYSDEQLFFGEFPEKTLVFNQIDSDIDTKLTKTVMQDGVYALTRSLMPICGSFECALLPDVRLTLDRCSSDLRIGTKKPNSIPNCRIGEINKCISVYAVFPNCELDKVTEDFVIRNFSWWLNIAVNYAFVDADPLEESELERFRKYPVDFEQPQNSRELSAFSYWLRECVKRGTLFPCSGRLIYEFSKLQATFSDKDERFVMFVLQYPGAKEILSVKTAKPERILNSLMPTDAIDKLFSFKNTFDSTHADVVAAFVDARFSINATCQDKLNKNKIPSTVHWNIPRALQVLNGGASDDDSLRMPGMSDYPPQKLESFPINGLTAFQSLQANYGKKYSPPFSKILFYHNSSKAFRNQEPWKNPNAVNSISISKLISMFGITLNQTESKKVERMEKNVTDEKDLRVVNSLIEEMRNMNHSCVLEIKFDIKNHSQDVISKWVADFDHLLLRAMVLWIAKREDPNNLFGVYKSHDFAEYQAVISNALSKRLYSIVKSAKEVRNELKIPRYFTDTGIFHYSNSNSGEQPPECVVTSFELMGNVLISIHKQSFAYLMEDVLRFIWGERLTLRKWFHFLWETETITKMNRYNRIEFNQELVNSKTLEIKLDILWNKVDGLKRNKLRKQLEDGTLLVSTMFPYYLNTDTARLLADTHVQLLLGMNQSVCSKGPVELIPIHKLNERVSFIWRIIHDNNDSNEGSRLNIVTDLAAYISDIVGIKMSKSKKKSARRYISNKLFDYLDMDFEFENKARFSLQEIMRSDLFINQYPDKKLMSANLYVEKKRLIYWIASYCTRVWLQKTSNHS